MKIARGIRSAIGWGYIAVFFIFLIGCAATRAVIDPPAETVTPPPVVDPAPGPPLGPPPGYVKPENYWVREKIILTSEPEPPASGARKSSAGKGKKGKKRSSS
jgi:hypothetical protein